MSLINLYLFKKTFKYIFQNIFIITFLILFINMIEISRLLENGGINISKLILLSLFKIPSIISETTPFIVVISIAFMYKNLITNNELISMRNVGYSIIDIFKPVSFGIFLFGLFYALFKSPPDAVQGNSVRIMYVHVPSSFIALGCFGVIGILSIVNLVFKVKFLPFATKSLAPIGFVFSIISIVTGSLWGKPTWGVWWVWDARLTSMLILSLFYLF